MTIPGLFFDKVKDDYPVKRSNVGVGFGFQAIEDQVEGKFELGQGMKFLNTEETALVQVGMDVLSTNYLKPYPHWETFKPAILNNLAKYREVANPSGVKRIGLRYMNNIQLEEGIDLRECFKYFPGVPSDLPDNFKDFNLITIFPFDDDKLRLSVASVEPKEEETSLTLLDLDYLVDIPEKVELDGIADWIENAHNKILETFHSCVSEDCKATFNEE